MSFTCIPVPVKWQEGSCAKCGENERAPGDTVCPWCADINRRVAEGHRLGHPEQK